MLFIPERHEALAGGVWGATEARAAIQRIVDDIVARVDPATLWPVHPREREPGDRPVPQPMLYNGATGVVWALRQLTARGHARIALDLDPLIDGLAAHSLRWIEVHASEMPSYFLGHSAVLLLQWQRSRDPATADALYALVESNLRNPAREALWGSPGTLVAALHAFEATGEARWRTLFRRGTDILWEQMIPVRHGRAPDREVWIWDQDLYGRNSRYLGAGHGFAGNLHPVLRGAALLEPDVVAAFERRAAEALEVAAEREPGLVNWEPVFDPAAAGRPSRLLVQDCHGAPGIVCRLASTRSTSLQALLVDAGELIWQAGPLTKRPGLCHGTDGNGYAFLKLHAMTGEARWLARARAFAMHALAQSDALAVEHGCRVPSLWTGDLGLAVYLGACLDADPALPALDVF